MKLFKRYFVVFLIIALLFAFTVPVLGLENEVQPGAGDVPEGIYVVEPVVPSEVELPPDPADSQPESIGPEQVVPDEGEAHPQTPLPEPEQPVGEQAEPSAGPGFVYDPQPQSATEVALILADGQAEGPKWEFAVEDAWLPEGFAQVQLTDEAAGVQYWTVTAPTRAMATFAPVDIDLTNAIAIYDYDGLKAALEGISDGAVLLLKNTINYPKGTNKTITLGSGSSLGTIAIFIVAEDETVIFGAPNVGTEPGTLPSGSNSHFAIAAGDDVSITFKNVILEGGFENGLGGAGFNVGTDANLTLTNVVIQNARGMSDETGAAINLAVGANLTIQGNSLIQNYYRNCVGSFLPDNNGGAISAISGSVITLAGNTRLEDVRSTAKLQTDKKDTGAGIYAGINSTVILQDNASFINCYSEAGGAAIYAGQGTSITASGNVLFQGNDGSSSVTTNDPAAGGAIWLNSASLTTTGGVTFRENGSQGSVGFLGGAIYAHNGATVKLDGALFDGNNARFGGAIYATDTATEVEIKNTTLQNNAVIYHGGAVVAMDGAQITIEASHFIGNNTALSGNNYGGAIYASGAATSVQVEGDSTFVTNKSRDGGAIYLTAATLRIEDTRLEGNIALNGAGVYLAGDAVLQMDNVAFAGNVASTNGGGIYTAIATTGYTLTVQNATFEGNKAKQGGGVYIKGAALDVQNTAFDGNIATGDGAAIYAADSNVQVADATFTENDGNGWGGAVYLNNTKLAGHNLSFADNVSGKGAGIFSIGSGGGVTLTGELVFDRNIARENGGAIDVESGAALSISAEGNSRFEENLSSTTQSGYGGAIHTGGSININTVSDGNLAFTGNEGDNGGAISSPGGPISISGDVLFEGNYSHGGRGGAVFTQSGTVTISGDVAFMGNTSYNNTSSGHGGAVYAQNGTVLVKDNVSFTENYAVYGGAVAIDTNNGTGKLTLQDDVCFVNNEAKSRGGAVHMNDGTMLVQGRVLLQGNKTTDDTVNQYGGGIYANNGYLEITDDVQIIGNQTNYAGGGVYKSVTAGNANVTGSYDLVVGGNVLFEGNSVGNETGGYLGSGGAICHLTGDNDAGGRVLLHGGVRFENNFAGENAGAVYVKMNSVLDIKDAVSFSGNRARNAGGAVFVSYYSTLTVDDDVVMQANHSDNVGGAIFTQGYTVVQGDAKITGNTAASRGGGIHIGLNSKYTQKGADTKANQGSATVQGSAAVTGNTAGNHGGGISTEWGDIVVQANGSITGNTAKTGHGGGLYMTNSLATITLGGSASIAHNSAPLGDGGGVYVSNFWRNMTADAGVSFASNWASAYYLIHEQADKDLHAGQITTQTYTTVSQLLALPAFVVSGQQAPDADFAYSYNNFDVNFRANPALGKQVDFSRDGIDYGDRDAVLPGDILTYTVTYVNYGSSAETVQITDVVPAGTSLVPGSITGGGTLQADGKTILWAFTPVAVGSSIEVTFQVEVLPSALTVIENVAKAELQNGTKVESNPVTNPIDPAVTKEVDTTSPAGQNGDTVQVGDSIVYRISATNQTGALADIIITDTLEAGLTYQDSAPQAFDVDGQKVTWKFENVQAGETVTATIKVRVNENAATSVGNQANVKIGNNVDVDTDRVVNPVEPPPPPVHKVTYNANGGVGDVQTDADLAHDSEYTVRTKGSLGYSREGYTFTGWNTAADGSGTAYSESQRFNITADLYLYAQWKKDEDGSTTSPGGSSSGGDSSSGGGSSSEPGGSSSEPGGSSSSESTSSDGGGGGSSSGTGGGSSTSRASSSRPAASSSSAVSSRPGSSTTSAVASTSGGGSSTPEDGGSSTSAGSSSGGGTGGSGGGSSAPQAQTREEIINETGTVQIFGNEIPRGNLSLGTGWSLLNFILSVLALLSAVVVTVRVFLGKKQKEQDDKAREETDQYSTQEEEESEQDYKRRTLRKLLALLSGILPMLLFLILERFTVMVWVTKWTPLIVAAFVLHLILLTISILHKKQEQEPEDPEEGAPA